MSELRTPIEEKSEITFDRPNILTNALEENGVLSKTIRDGAAVQLELRSTVEWSDDPVEEVPFVIRGFNRINFGGGVLSVINDEVRIADKIWPETSPSATGYMSLVGKEVMTYFSCKPDQLEMARLGRGKENPVYKIVRHCITLP